ncbi:MAG TPA: hypothetical protein VMS60_07670 [Solirubrobacterales bacterium]|nr:hypothetical protein [Solirubrobacterales bacterium]
MVAAALCSTAPASAATYVPAPEPVAVPPFCQEAIVHDYVAPFQRMPKLHAPPAGGHLGFGPVSLAVTSRPALVVDGGKVGYRLSLRKGARAAHPDWDIATTLTRLDWKGRPTKILKRARRRVSTLTSARDAGATFAVDKNPTVYRVTAVFRNASDHRLGGFGFYFRVVPPTRKAQLTLNAAQFERGQALFARVENLGSETAIFGAEVQAQRRHPNGAWEAVGDIWRPPISSAGTAGPGRTGPCIQYKVHPHATPGRYRLVKDDVSFAIPPRRYDPAKTTLIAEFDVLEEAPQPATPVYLRADASTAAAP